MKYMIYTSHKWSVTDAKKSSTGRECLAILCAVDKFASCVRGKPFTLIMDCLALTWMFQSQSLSAKYYRCALRLMELDMTLE